MAFFSTISYFLVLNAVISVVVHGAPAQQSAYFLQKASQTPAHTEEMNIDQMNWVNQQVLEALQKNKLKLPPHVQQGSVAIIPQQVPASGYPSIPAPSKPKPQGPTQTPAPEYVAIPYNPPQQQKYPPQQPQQGSVAVIPQQSAAPSKPKPQEPTKMSAPQYYIISAHPPQQQTANELYVAPSRFLPFQMEEETAAPETVVEEKKPVYCPYECTPTPPTPSPTEPTTVPTTDPITVPTPEPTTLPPCPPVETVETTPATPAPTTSTPCPPFAPVITEAPITLPPAITDAPTSPPTTDCVQSARLRQEMKSLSDTGKLLYYDSLSQTLSATPPERAGKMYAAHPKSPLAIQPQFPTGVVTYPNNFPVYQYVSDGNSQMKLVLAPSSEPLGQVALISQEQAESQGLL